jgi:peptidoglycan hydrolase CwlO-like protein
VCFPQDVIALQSELEKSEGALAAAQQQIASLQNSITALQTERQTLLTQARQGPVDAAVLQQELTRARECVGAGESKFVDHWS